MVPLPSYVVQWPINLLVYVIVVIANVEVKFENVVDLKWFPSNLHIHLHESVDVFHPLETLCHVPF